jgi:hypothetical protein
VKPWTKLKLEQVALGRGINCEYCGKSTHNEPQAHHGPFGRDERNHKEYNCVENMVLLDYPCNNDRVLDNDEGRLWCLEFQAGLHGKDHMIDWLESLKETHKVTTDIDYFIRVLEDE